jgi:hypothetical protein
MAASPKFPPRSLRLATYAGPRLAVRAHKIQAPPAAAGPPDQRQRLRDCVARIDYDGTTGEMAITLNAPSSTRKESA